MGAKGQPKTGGRKKGTPNRRTAAQAYAAEIGGDMPLDHLLAIMRDPGQPEDRRLSAAVAAAPYIHCKFKAIDYRALNGAPTEYEVSLNFGANEESAVRSIPIDWGDRGLLMNEENSIAVNGAKVMSE